MKIKPLQFFNIVLLIINAVAFYVGPKINHLESNAAGILALAAMIAIGVWLIHLIVVCFTFFKKRNGLLIGFTILMIPLSFYLWLFTFGSRI